MVVDEVANTSLLCHILWWNYDKNRIGFDHERGTWGEKVLMLAYFGLADWTRAFENAGFGWVAGLDVSCLCYYGDSEYWMKAWCQTYRKNWGCLEIVCVGNVLFVNGGGLC